MKNQLFQLSIPTPDGQFIARYSAKGLAELNFPSVGRATRLASREHTARRPYHDPPLASRDGGRIEKFPGRAQTEKSAAARFAGGTEFQKSVWNALRKISTGRTKSYGEIAQAIGKPKAVRAVGGACGANPVPVFVPCHRVLAANRKLGGFSGGLDWKRTLLAREGIAL